MTRLTFLGCVAALTLASGALPVLAHDAARPPVYSIIGAWEMMVTVREDAEDCTTAPLNAFPPNPFPGLQTFHLGGTLSETGSRSPPSRRSPGTGVWRRTGRSTFAGHQTFEIFDVNGLFARTMNGWTDYTIGEGGDTLTGVSRFTFTDTSGNVLRYCATMEGTRITL